MDWENERYVRVYVRETVDDVVLSWEADALWSKLLRRFDRAGVVDMGKHGWRGVAALVRMPAEVVLRVYKELLDDGRIEQKSHYIIAPNFMEAQEAKASSKQRQAESRARYRDRARREAIEGEIVTDCDSESQNVTDRADSVTRGHTVSHHVTPSLAVPSLAVPSLDIYCSSGAEREQPELELSHPPTESEVTKAEIEWVYQSYPRKAGKAKGLEKAYQTITTRDDFELYRRCVESMARAYPTKEDKQFCPHFSTFVSGKRWRDEDWPGADREPVAEPMATYDTRSAFARAAKGEK